MSENIKKITKAFMADLDSRENQNILKPSARPFNNQAIKLMKWLKRLPKRFIN
ncbi:hypothetical protein E5P87_06750 [Helicobacter pylori]|nr:hypothetical protein E5P87_06750 [Helicobacter pylori]